MAERNAKQTSTLEILPEYSKVSEFLESGVKLVLVTGGAGTGKSTFINWIQTEFDGTVLIAAPTGIAALTVGGQTIHALCGFPPAWVVPGDIRRKNKSPAGRAGLLVIDEISMVNANLLDGVDAFLRLNRNSTEPFGGIPVVLVGDLFQLPPIVTNETESLFRSEYYSPRFFAAHVLRDLQFEDVELTRSFRQADAEFIQVLGKIREGVDLQIALAELNASAKILPEGREGAVWLCPRNADVDRINRNRLERLKGASKTYEAHVEGAFRTRPLPVPDRLTLKVGAQVVMANNTGDWVNGSIATVTELLPTRIRIRLGSSNRIHEVTAHKWEQYEYVVDEESDRIERVMTGSYVQLPVNLAWAMTIHKSQGLTIPEVHLDLGRGAFATGQVYVALSRCTQIAGLSMSRPLEERDVLVDPEAKAFHQAMNE